MLLRAADKRLGLVSALDRVLVDPRDPACITHRQVDLLRQRTYGLALGYEDLNDHDTPRRDLLWQTALERSGPSWPLTPRFAGLKREQIARRRSPFTRCSSSSLLLLLRKRPQS